MRILHRSLFLVTSLLIFICCSTSKVISQGIGQGSNVKPVPESTTKPTWINDPMSSCQTSIEWCAAGEGIGMMEAEANARRAIGLIFESKIQSKKSFSKLTYTKEEEKSNSSGKTNQISDHRESSVVEESTSELDEISDTILNAVTIKNTFSDKDKNYALAVLDKMRVGKDLKHKIELIDEKLTALAKESKRGVYYKMVKLDEDREQINLRYQLLNGQLIPKVVPYETIAQKKALLGQNKVTIWIHFNQDDGLETLLPTISKLLHERDYSTLPPDHKSLIPYNLELIGQLSISDLKINVPGFKRYNFSLALYFKNKSGEKIFTTEKNSIQDGRSYEQAFEKAIPILKKELAESWSDLSVE